MADESNENAITGDVHGMAPDTGKKDDADVSASGVLDLRPPQESLKAESWRDYQRGVLATFDGTGANVTITDVKTNLSRTLTVGELKTVARIDTMTAAD